MNEPTKKLLTEFNQLFTRLGDAEIRMIAYVLAMRLCDEYIATHPLPEGEDADEMRSILMITTITRAAEDVQRLATAAQSTAADEETARAAAEAAIAKASGKLN